MVKVNENMNRVSIVTEKMDGSLSDLIRETKGGFGEEEAVEIMYQIVRTYYEYIYLKERKFRKKVIGLIEKCLEEFEEDRCDWDELINHSVFEKFRTEKKEIVG